MPNSDSLPVGMTPVDLMSKCHKKKNPEETQDKWQALLQEKYERMLANEDHSLDFVVATAEKLVDGKTWHGNNIGVFTSGGDSQGMNAAVRAIARMGMDLECKVFYIKEGYEGMIEGGDNFEEATMISTSNIINVGGTFIGSARCNEFMDRAGRLKAAKNLVVRGINNLICIGGDGSLAGANIFRQEWPSLLRELLDKDLLNKPQTHKVKTLNVVGIVGSIDNDFCGTERTLGCDSALHRILESVDDIGTTAASHKRAFVMEIMGRMCGYLPLVAGLAGEASVIFIPENPPEGDWKQYLCDKLLEKSKGGEVRRTHIILVAEGAMDRNLNPIRCTDVQKVLTERMNMDTRVTVLGHVQRGGSTSAFDRILGSRMGVEAVFALMDASPSTPAYVLGFRANEIVRVPLMQAVEKTQYAGQMIASGDFDEVVKLRGRSLFFNLYVHQLLTNGITHPRLLSKNKKPLRVAMVHVGEPACGMNAVARAFVTICITQGYQPVFIYNSWAGLVNGTVRAVNRNDVYQWTAKGGSLLGTSVQTIKDFGKYTVAKALTKHSISGLMIVGGFEAFKSAAQMESSRKMYPEFCIPTIVIPATIANNVPGMDFSLGLDTAINQICKACDDLKSSARSLKKCIYVVEVGGENCGCLATLAGIATGADRAFIREEPFTVRDLQDTCRMLKNKLEHSGFAHGLILRNENANPNLTTDFIFRMFKEEGKPQFCARKSVLGDTQEGHRASPYDRNAGLKMGTRSTLWLLKCMEKYTSATGDVYSDAPDSLVVSSMQKGKLGFVSVQELLSKTDFFHSVPKYNWWLELRPLFGIFSRFD